MVIFVLIVGILQLIFGSAAFILAIGRGQWNMAFIQFANSFVGVALINIALNEPHNIPALGLTM